MTLLPMALLLLADIVHLKNGKQVEGRVVIEGPDFIKVQTAAGVVQIDRVDIARIEEKPFGAPPKAAPGPAKAKDEPWRKVKLDSQFRDPFINFRVSFPKDWTSKQTSDGKVSFEGPRDGIYTPRLDMFIERPKKDFFQYVQEHQDQLKKNKEYSEVAFSSFEATAQGGKSAVFFVATFKEGIIPMATLWFFLDAGERKFMLMFYATQVLLARYEPTIQAVLRSFRAFDEHAVDDAQREKFRRQYNAGAELARQKKFDEAIPRFESAAAVVPRYPDIHSMLGVMYASTQNFARAAEAFRAAAALDPENFEYAYNLSGVLQSQKKYAEALQFADRACEIDPGREAAWVSRGNLLAASREYKKAKESFLKALAINPESAVAHYNLGVTCEAGGDARTAEKEYRETLKIDPAHQGAQDGLKRLKP